MAWARRGGSGRPALSLRAALARRQRTALACFACWAALALGCGTAESPSPTRPDLVLITIDTLRADHLGAYGYRLDVSPNVDRLAAAGVRFDEATAQWPVTWPSLASMLTGVYPGRNGVVWSPKRAIALEQVTLAELLKEQGYRTGAVVSNASIGRSMQFDQGFDTFIESWIEEYARRFPGQSYRDQTIAGVKQFTSAKGVTDDAIAWLEAQPSAEPLFLWAHYMDPHGPYTSPAGYEDFFAGEYASKPIPLERIPEHHREQGEGARTPSTDLADYVANYDREIRYLDDQLARLLASLEARWQGQPGLVVFTADHGESFDEHGEYLGHGLTTFRPTTRVPLVLRMPGRLPAGRVVEEPVALIDLLPTLLELLGVPAPGHVQGMSLLGRVAGEVTAPSAIFGHAGIVQPPQHFIRRGQFKLVRAEHPQDVARLGAKLALYDLAADPGETQNVIAQHADVAARLERELDAWLAVNRPSSATGPAADHDGLEQELLKRLGYIE